MRYKKVKLKNFVKDEGSTLRTAVRLDSGGSTL